jgi:hypothetical protein
VSWHRCPGAIDALVATCACLDNQSRRSAGKTSLKMAAGNVSDSHYRCSRTLKNDLHAAMLVNGKVLCSSRPHSCRPRVTRTGLDEPVDDGSVRQRLHPAQLRKFSGPKSSPESSRSGPTDYLRVRSGSSMGACCVAPAFLHRRAPRSAHNIVLPTISQDRHGAYDR